MSSGGQHERIREPDHPILGSEDVHFRRGAQNGDGRDDSTRKEQMLLNSIRSEDIPYLQICSEVKWNDIV